MLGKLDKVGSSKTLKFRLFVRKKMAKGFTVSFKDAKSEKFRSLLHDKMIDKIGAHYYAGGSLAEFIASKPSAEFDARWGDPALFLATAYESAWGHVGESPDSVHVAQDHGMGVPRVGGFCLIRGRRWVD